MKSIKHFLKEYGFVVLCACIISSTFVFSYKVCAVSGESMVPTLKNNEIVLMRTNIKTLDRYEIVVFNNEKTTGNYIKRVLGLPGETLYMDNNILYVNGEPIKDAVNVDMNKYGYLKEGITLNKDEYFVMGDNRNDSYDSRDIGPVNIKDIKGRVTLSLSQMSKIENERGTLS